MRLLPASFLAVIVLGTLLLMVPAAAVDGQVRPLAAAFTATSAVSVTGLTVVDTATYWTPYGQGIILLLAQLGGFGVMSLATLLSLLANGQLRLSESLVVKAETQASSLGAAAGLLRRIALSMFIAEFIVVVLMTWRLMASYGESFGQALWHGVYFAVMSFTNAGFSLHSTSLMGFTSDAWIIWPLCVSVFAGSLGFPAFFEIISGWRRPRLWSVHTKLTVFGFVVLYVIGFLFILWFEWTNPATMGPMPWQEKVNATVAGTTMPRSAGFNAVDYAHLRDETGVITLILMFIGGGSAGTSGGLKVTTFFLLAFVLWAEVRGHRDVVIAQRRIPYDTQRLAMTVALLSIGIVTIGSIVLVILTELPLDFVIFDVISAFGTVGLSRGITPELPAAGQITLMVLMFIGRVGTVTTASALALRSIDDRYRFPEERPIVG